MLVPLLMLIAAVLFFAPIFAGSAFMPAPRAWEDSPARETEPERISPTTRDQALASAMAEIERQLARDRIELLGWQHGKREDVIRA